MSPQPRACLLNIDPYRPGNAGRLFTGRRIQLASNENPLGCSNQVQQALAHELSHVHRYPDDTGHDVVEALAEKFNLDHACIAIGNGSFEIMQRIFMTFLNPHDEVLTFKHIFMMIGICTHMANAKAVVAPDNNFTLNVDAMIQHLTPRTKLVVVANPNNPTGTYVPFDDIQRLHAAMRDDTLLLVDLAYIEYLNASEAGRYHHWAKQHTNIILTQTFSKIYGLSGLRLGWAYGHADLMAHLSRMRLPFGVNRMALAAGQAALRDDAFVEQTKLSCNRAREQFCAALTAADIPFVPSSANFIMADLGPHAQAIVRELSACGIFVRPLLNYGLQQHIRITIGTPEEMHIVATEITARYQQYRRSA